MKQSENLSAELRCMDNFMAIEGFKFYKEEADTGNPYNTVFGIKVVSGAFQGCVSCEYDIKSFRIFVRQLCELYLFQRDRVVLSEMYCGSHVTFSMGKTGHVKAEGVIFDSGREQSLTFAFETDQSMLPPFINGLKKMIS